MNKPKSNNSSNNSGTSSETSETQSVEDHQTVLLTNNRSLSLSRAKNSWKRMKELAAEKEKENEAKRPPWRAVSVSTLTKPDKSALLRAKLLDASRRLRAGKANVGLQTDFVPTKLMKEASVDTQHDLILYKDIGILTDGQYSRKKDGYQQYVLTYSMSQMTESVATVSRYTQTLLPKAYKKDVINRYLPKCDEDENVIISNFETGLDDTITRIRKLYFDEESQFQRNSVDKNRGGLNLTPTLESWNFDDDLVEMESDRHFIPYTIEPYNQWRSFEPVPFHLRGNSVIGTMKIDWYALLQSIDDLIKESNHLVDKLEQIMRGNGLHQSNLFTSLGQIKKFKSINFKPPSEHWLPIIDQQEQQLKQILRTPESSYVTPE
ncbi:uncharacterized protein LOC117896865 [Drosophila subobscura]|uniref:uncharacterized protein LOC117896865 n=1 Tax=Drosophila subobscura TaxID=7241 RepID=UPI00155A1B2F|nr:uncharacterized protein LOC117896865 [Drosophila subobscura]